MLFHLRTLCFDLVLSPYADPSLSSLVHRLERVSWLPFLVLPEGVKWPGTVFLVLSEISTSN